MKKVLAICVFLIFTLGCRAAGPKTVAEQMQYMKALSDFARDNDMAMSVSMSFTGRAGLFQQASIGIDTGVTVQGTLIANAGDAEPNAKPDGE